MQANRCAWLLMFFVSAAAAAESRTSDGASPPPTTAPPRATIASRAETAAAACPPAAGRVLRVGPGQPYPTVRAAAKAARHGDTVHIAAGDYYADVATWRANNLTICGIGGRARLLAEGAHERGKGIWVITGADATVVNVQFHGAKVPDGNGAGIRQEGRNLSVRSAGFFDNENGILAGNDASSTITIEGSEFARNGTGDGYTHNMYVGKIGRLNVRSSYFHEARVGHQLKTRSRESVIESSYFVDGPAGTSSHLLNFDNGGRVVLRGNLLHKGPHAENPALITHYANSWGDEFNSLTLEHNTLVSTYPGGRFINLNTGAAVTLNANIFAGTKSPVLVHGGVVTETNNVVTAASHFPGAANVAQPSFWPDAVLLPRIALKDASLAAYSTEAPRPFFTRAVKGPARQAGALQAAP